MHRWGARSTREGSAESSKSRFSLRNLICQLTRALKSMSDSNYTVDWAQRLGAVSFNGTQGPASAIEWLSSMEKVLE